ncbi:MAG TPA: OmpA family protein [Luteolibacter sp.]
MDEPRSKLPYLVFGVSLAFGLIAGSLVLLQLKQKKEDVATSPSESEPAPRMAQESKPVEPPAAKPVRPVEKTLPAEPKANDPAILIARIGAAMEAGDFDTAAKESGDSALAPKLREFAGGHPMRLRPPGVREVGEIEFNALNRWALEFDGTPGRDRLLFDLRRKDGRWSIERVILPPVVGEEAIDDSLTIADAFLQATLRQDFEVAKSYVDSSVSDATIAGLCILFEEGDYHLRKQKPLRAMLQRPGATGYLVNVETADGNQAAQFSLLLKPTGEGRRWRVSEVNLDQLIADYAKRFSGGDLYYTPIVKNPRGGDTLVLYFEFDEDQLAPRTKRQLEIVARILSKDGGKKLTITGHTDALGGTDYNTGLSSRRADIVRDFLVGAGVTHDQIVTQAKGMTQPRRPNVTESGEDNPEGRRANRRTEIYLDF